MRGIMKITTGLVTLGLLSTAAQATETITYTYDARGRLIKVVHAGSVNANNQVCYTYDKADNRTLVTTRVNGTCP